MDITRLTVNIIASFGLLVFGGWILYSGVKMILQKYDWKPVPGQKSVPGQGQIMQTNNVNQLLSSLNKMIDPSINNVHPLRTKDAVGGNAAPQGDQPAAGNVSVEDVQPAEGNAEDDGAADNTDTTGTENKKETILDGVAKIIKVLPDLLKADFGPIVVICFAGITVMGAGFYIIIMVINKVG